MTFPFKVFNMNELCHPQAVFATGKTSICLEAVLPHAESAFQ